MHLKNTTQCLACKKYPVNVRCHSCKGQGRQAFLTAAASNGLKTKQNKNSIFHSKKLQKGKGDIELLKVEIFVNYLEDGLNSIISPYKIPT